MHGDFVTFLSLALALDSLRDDDVDLVLGQDGVGDGGQDGGGEGEEAHVN